MGELNNAKDVSTFESGVLQVWYGKMGTGKTTAIPTLLGKKLVADVGDNGLMSIKTAKNTKFLSMRPKRIKTKKVKGIQKYRKIDTPTRVENLIAELKAGGHGYNAFILDGGTWLKDAIVQAEAKKLNQKTLLWKQYGEPAQRLKNILISLAELAQDQDLVVVVICQEQQVKIDEEDNVIVDEEIQLTIEPALFPSCNLLLLASASEILHFHKRARMDEDEEGDEIQVIEHAVHLESVAYVTKTRKPKEIKLPKVLVDFSYKKYAKMIEGGK